MATKVAGSGSGPNFEKVAVAVARYFLAVATYTLAMADVTLCGLSIEGFIIISGCPVTIYVAPQVPQGWSDTIAAM